LSRDIKIAVVIGTTASYGEAATISFKEMSNARFFGEKTCGLSTANASISLSNGDRFILTTATMAPIGIKKLLEEN